MAAKNPSLMAGNVAVVCGCGDVGKGSFTSSPGANARVKVTEINSICALQAAMDSFEVVLLEDVVETPDLTLGVDSLLVGIGWWLLWAS